ncbi:MAG: hypothetical protein AAFX57_14740 [Bacteroidota bacterium]
MVKNLFFCFCCGLFFSVDAQDCNVIVFHSEFEEDQFSKPQNQLAQLLMADESATMDEYIQFDRELDDYINSLKIKRAKTKKNKDFISFVFYRTHRKYLKRYAPFTSLASLSKSGKYDCLSATSLYSYIFSELGIDHSVIETSYHIYLKINADEGDLLIESTDPIYGFVDRQNEIEERLNEIDKDAVAVENTYSFTSVVNDKISFQELIGLQYYNLAVAAFNAQNYENAINLLSKGLIFRNHSRTTEFGLVIAQAVMKDDDLDQDSKLGYVNKLQRLFHSSTTLASR